jgi:hypothetical protein
MTSSDGGRPKTTGQKQSRIWLAICWAALTIVAVIIAIEGRPLWWFIAAGWAAFGGYWFYRWREGSDAGRLR